MKITSFAHKPGQCRLSKQSLKLGRASESTMAASIAQNNYTIEESSSHSYDNFIEYSIASTPDAHEMFHVYEMVNREKSFTFETRTCHVIEAQPHGISAQNAELPINSEIRRLKSTQGRDRYAAPSSLRLRP